MIKKKVRRIFALICMFVMATSQMTVQAQATAQSIDERTVSIISSNLELELTDGGVAKIEAYLNGKLGITYTRIEATLQKQTSSSWKDVESWEKSSDSRSVSLAETYPVSSGTYRVVATFTADSETKSMTTASRTY